MFVSRLAFLIPPLPDTLAEAQAHSSVFLPFVLEGNLLNSMYAFSRSRTDSGVSCGPIGDEGMLSQMEACGLRWRVGVRGGGLRSSEREAIRSNEGKT